MYLTEQQQAKHSSNPSWSGKTVETSVRSAKTQITSTEIMCDMWTPPKLRILRELEKIRKCKLLCALCQRRKTIENLRKPRKFDWNHLRHLGKRQRANVGHCTLFSEQLHIHRFHCRRKGTPKKRFHVFSTICEVEGLCIMHNFEHSASSLFCVSTVVKG